MLVLNPRFDMGLVNTGRISMSRQPDWPEDMVKKIFAPPGPLKYLAAKSLAEGGEWYTWDNTEGEVVDGSFDTEGDQVSREEPAYTIPVGYEVRTRSGTYPSIPYVKQEDGSWKPKYNDK